MQAGLRNIIIISYEFAPVVYLLVKLGLIPIIITLRTHKVYFSFPFFLVYMISFLNLFIANACITLLLNCALLLLLSLVVS